MKPSRQCASFSVYSKAHCLIDAFRGQELAHRLGSYTEAFHACFHVYNALKVALNSVYYVLSPILSPLNSEFNCSHRLVSYFCLDNKVWPQQRKQSVDISHIAHTEDAFRMLIGRRFLVADVGYYPVFLFKEVLYVVKDFCGRRLLRKDNRIVAGVCSVDC